MKERAVVHLNIIGFKATVAAVKDKSLKGRPYVIAGATGGRSLALDCSPEAVRQGVSPGTALAAAEKRIKDLIILSPDIPAYEAMNKEIEKVAAKYAPVWENDRAGNLYLDITGTTSLFGLPIDCSSRVLGDILERTAISPATAVACNKLVSKVATRTIRPVGLIQVQGGTEAEFLNHQDIRILPGMGQNLLQTATVVGITEIGEIAALSEAGVIALFGKRGSLLRNMALGIDGSPVLDRSSRKSITQQADFDEDVIEETAIKAAIETLAELGGFEMRNEKLGMRKLSIFVVYADGVEMQGFEKTKRLLVTDKEIMTTAYAVYKKTAVRRIRIRSIAISFDDLIPLGYQPDLFEPETEIKNRKLQEAVDKIQIRFGIGKVTRGVALVSPGKSNRKLLTMGAGEYAH
jgi:DNA polymerase-4